MKNRYTIGEIAKLLGLTNDAIRFYEKKGLVHPQVNEKNQYRMYTIENVLELLDIIYYRHLEIPVADICELHKTKDPKDMAELLIQKEEAAKKRIQYEQLLLKKITYLKSLYLELKEQADICSVQWFPASYVLLESEGKSSFFIHDIQYLSQDEFVLCALHRKYQLVHDHPIKQSLYITLTQEIVDRTNLHLPSQGRTILPTIQCIHRIVNMQEDGIQECDIQPMLAFAKKQHLVLEDHCLVREVPLTFYNDHKHYYAEIFIPIKK